MLVSNTRNHQDAGSGSKLSGGYSEITGQVVAMERPRQGQGFVPLRDNAGQLSKRPLVQDTTPKA
jgi:hypothetical protein